MNNSVICSLRHGQKLVALSSFGIERLMRTIGSPFAIVTGLPFLGLRIVSDGVIKGVLHPFRFIEISDEQMLFATGSKVPCLWFR